jgi:hypothetical protein
VDRDNFTLNCFIYWYVVYHSFHGFENNLVQVTICMSVLLSPVKLTLVGGRFCSRLSDTKSQHPQQRVNRSRLRDTKSQLTQNKRLTVVDC